MAMAASTTFDTSSAMANPILKKGALLALASAVGITMFLGMHLLIRADGIVEMVESERTYLNFVRVDAAEDVQTRDRRPPEPPPPEAPPDTPEMRQQMANITPNLDMNMPNIGSSINSGDGPLLGALNQGGGMSGFDTDVIPVVRVAPNYPRAAAQARLEGYVTMEVTINPDGTVSNAKVLESQPPRIFDRAAIDAMRNWKFRPKVVGGTPVAQRAKQTIEFTLGGN